MISFTLMYRRKVSTIVIRITLAFAEKKNMYK